MEQHAIQTGLERMTWATPEPCINLKEGINLHFLKITQDEKDLMFTKDEYLWRHPKGLFITEEGVMAIRTLRRKNKAKDKKILTK